MGSSIFNKIFRRKSKPEALHLSNSSLSTPTNQNGAVLASSKNKRNILGRKKKANKAAFPTFSNNSDKKGNSGKKKPLANHAEKENAPRQYDVPNGQYVAPLDNQQALFDQHQRMSYTKPTLSLIKEEASPRNGEYVSPVPTPTSASSRGNNQQQQHVHQQMLSPMSGSKPPLTPNRLRGQSERRSPHADYLNVATNHYSNHYPSLTDEPLSPASLRGQQILSPHSMASSNDMCFSQDAEDEEYNRIAFEGAHNTSNGKQDGFYDGAAFPGEKDPFSSSALPMPQSSFTAPQESQDDLRAWTPSPTKKASFTFTDKMLSPSAIGGQHRHAGDKKSKDVFGNFGDFDPFVPNEQFTSRNKGSSSRSAANQHNVSPVGAWLEDSRVKRSGSSRGMDRSVGNGSYGQHQHRSSSSFNSAPVITPSYVRSQVARSKMNNSSSISKVIDNLELHVNKRQGSNASNTGQYVSKDFVSEASSRDSRRSAESAIRDAKERIKRENLVNNESKIIDILANGGSGAQAVAAMNAKSGDNNWLFDEVTGTLGPRSHAADLESLGGRSNRSGKSKSSMGNKSHRSHKSKTSRSHRHRSRNDGDVSVDSRTSRNSRNSYRSYQTTKSMVSQMSQESRSVANDLLRLEAQLSMVGKSCSGASTGGGNSVAAELSKRRDDCGVTVTSRDFSVSRSSSGVPRPKGSRHVSAMARKAAARSMQAKVSVIAPPGKLGIILANRTDSRGTVVSGVRTSSVLADKVSPGDRIIAIDDEDVSQMNVKEITTIMARKSEFERVLTLYAAPKQQYD